MEEENPFTEPFSQLKSECHGRSTSDDAEKYDSVTTRIAQRHSTLPMTSLPDAPCGTPVAENVSLAEGYLVSDVDRWSRRFNGTFIDNGMESPVEMSRFTCTRTGFNEMAIKLAQRNTGWRLYYKNDTFGRVVTWIESCSFLRRCNDLETDNHLMVTYFVSYSECYEQPQLHFMPERPMSQEEWRGWVGDVCCAPSGERQEYDAPIVSLTFCEELQMALWGIHQCDSTELLTVAAAHGVLGDLLEMFLQCIAGFVGMDRQLIPCSEAMCLSHWLNRVMFRRTWRVLLAPERGTFDPYRILGVSPSASKDEVKVAYRRLALRFHPDGGTEGSTERFQAVQEAYEAINSGKWKPQAASASGSGGHGWDPRMGMYVYEQPGSTTENYVDGHTQTILRLCVAWTAAFVALRFFLLWVFPWAREPAAPPTLDWAPDSPNAVSPDSVHSLADAWADVGPVDPLARAHSG